MTYTCKYISLNDLCLPLIQRYNSAKIEFNRVTARLTEQQTGKYPYPERSQRSSVLRNTQ